MRMIRIIFEYYELFQDFIRGIRIILYDYSLANQGS